MTDLEWRVTALEHLQDVHIDARDDATVTHGGNGGQEQEQISACVVSQRRQDQKTLLLQP